MPPNANLVVVTVKPMVRPWWEFPAVAVSEGSLFFIFLAGQETRLAWNWGLRDSRVIHRDMRTMKLAEMPSRLRR